MDRMTTSLSLYGTGVELQKSMSHIVSPIHEGQRGVDDGRTPRLVEWGMGERIYPRNVRGAATLERIDDEVEGLMDDAYTTATSILNARRDVFLILVRRLITEETLSGGNLRQLMTSPSPQ